MKFFHAALLAALMLPAAAHGDAEAENAKRLGDRAWESRDLPAAHRHYTGALERAPGLLAARFNLGTLLLDMRRPAEARFHLHQVLAVRPGNPDVLLGLASAYSADGDLDQAQALLEELVLLHDTHAAGHRDLGLLFHRRERHADARRHLERALALGERDPAALSTLATLQLGFGAHGEAIATLKTALAKKPADPELLLTLGMAHVEAREDQLALEPLGRISGDGPQAAAARFWSGRALRRLGRAREALAALSDAIRLGFTAPAKSYPLHAYLELGLAHLAAGDSASALPNLRVAAGQGVSLDAALRAESATLPPAAAAALAGAARAIATPSASPGAPAPPSPAVRLVDEAKARGVTFAHATRFPIWDLAQAFGPGVAFVDLDGDGGPDLYFPGSGEGAPPRAGALYRNLGGVFHEVAAAARLSETGRGQGALACDLDNDGYEDLVVSGYRQLAVWWNDGDGTFRRQDLIAPDRRRFFTGAAAVDADRDGLLDLYVGAYSTFDADKPGGDPEILTERDGSRHLSTLRAQHYPAEPDLVLRNRGARRFEDATRATGVADLGRTLGVAAFDADGDGWTDVYTANDTTANDLWINRGGRFTGEAAARFVNDARGSMGIAVADTSGRGAMDLFVTNWAYEANGLFRAGRKGYADVADQAGLAEPSFRYVKWGAAFADLDGDGHQDLVYAQGHTTSNDYRAPDYRTSESHLTAQPMAVFRGFEKYPMEDVTAAWGLGGEVLNGRGLATGDVDGDGRLDVVVAVNNGPARVYRNAGPVPATAVTLELVGTRSPRGAAGARLTLASGAALERTTGGSYLSSHQPVLHLGLGAARALSGASVRWPSGRTQSLPALEAGRRHRIVEPD